MQQKVYLYAHHPYVKNSNLIQQSGYSTCNSKTMDCVSQELHPNFKFSPCVIIVNHFYYPTNALNYTKLRG